MTLTRRQFLKLAGLGTIYFSLPINLFSPKKAKASSIYTYSFPHFVSSESWETGITIVNPNSEQANLVLSAYDTNGNLLIEKTVP